MNSIGKKGIYTMEVGPEQTALAMGSGTIEVCATPAVLACMEGAAVAALAGELGADETTVGVHADLRHLAATPVGGRIQAEATLIVQEGKSYTFAITCRDDCGKIAECSHTRVKIKIEPFMQKALQRK